MNDIEIIKQYKEYEPFWEHWYIKQFLGADKSVKMFKITRSDVEDGEKDSFAVLKIIGNVDTEAQRDDILSKLEKISKLRNSECIIPIEEYKAVKRPDTCGWDILIRMESLISLDYYLLGKEGICSVEEVMKIGIDLCNALEMCRSIHLYHTDVCFHNIFVTAAGTFKLGDASESVILSKNQEQNCDIQALGSVMRDLLKHVEENISESLKSIVEKACSSDVTYGYMNPLAMRRDLEQLYDAWNGICVDYEMIPDKNEERGNPKKKILLLHLFVLVISGISAFMLYVSNLTDKMVWNLGFGVWFLVMLGFFPAIGYGKRYFKSELAVHGFNSKWVKWYKRLLSFTLLEILIAVILLFPIIMEEDIAFFYICVIGLCAMVCVPLMTYGYVCYFRGKKTEKQYRDMRVLRVWGFVLYWILFFVLLFLWCNVNF